MPKLLGLKREVMSHDRAVGISRADHVRVDDFKARIVCARCHDIVNDTIESPASPLLKDLMRGEARLMSVEQQRILAAWGAKTACMNWAMMRRRRGVPVTHRKHLIQRAEPHPAVFVAYTRCAGGSVRAKMARTQITLHESGERLWVYDLAYVFDTIGLKVYGPCDGRKC